MVTISSLMKLGQRESYSAVEIRRGAPHIVQDDAQMSLVHLIAVHPLYHDATALLNLRPVALAGGGGHQEPLLRADGVQPLNHLLEARAARRVVVQALRHHRQQLRRAGGPPGGPLQLLRARHLQALAAVPHALHHLPVLEPAPGDVAGDHLPEHHAVGVRVRRLRAGGLPAQHLRRHVRHSASPRRRRRRLQRPGPDAREPEVRHLDAVALVEQEVGRLEVAVHDALRVQVGAPLRHVPRHLHQPPPARQLPPPVQQVVQRPPRQVLREEAQV
mmetsp:Transcript_16215/g.35233  ORF Transcript_16215/g.35233 Transcript_16215/m.35233 type:complete len:274 (-) Transcript_16215:520-1341(-)